MKKIVSVLLCAVFALSPFSVGAQAALLSPALEVLAPGEELVRAGIAGKDLVFSEGDFKRALGVSALRRITVTSLPLSSEGTLMLGGRRVREGQVIARRNLSDLRFVPKDERVTQSGFTFTCDSYAGGAPITASLYFLDRVNHTPTATGADGCVSLLTGQNIAYYGELGASDPEGDVLTFRIVDQPEYGTLRLADTHTGAFSYAPGEAYTGKDSFSYVVRDSYGNYSAPVKVSIRVQARKSSSSFTDLAQSPAHNAALALSDRMVMGGRIVGDDLYFDPDGTVSRAEFVGMALKVRGIAADSTLNVPSFADAEKTPVSLLRYLATAECLGVTEGLCDAEGCFRPDDAVTLPDAALVLTRVLGIRVGEETAAFAEEAGLPSLAGGAVLTLEGMGLLGDAEGADYTAPLTREACAVMLYDAMRYRG